MTDRFSVGQVDGGNVMGGDRDGREAIQSRPDMLWRRRFEVPEASARRLSLRGKRLD
jgi:hypothetical protein